MSLSQQNRDYRLDSEEGWRLLYPFTEPEVRRLRINTPVNLAHMSKSDAIVICGNTPLTIRETETLTSNNMYI